MDFDIKQFGTDKTSCIFQKVNHMAMYNPGNISKCAIGCHGTGKSKYHT